MSSTTQVTDFSDIYTDIINRTREQSGVTATTNLAKRYANTALQDMHIGIAESLPWAEREAVLITQPQYSTGTVTVTKGSTTLTGSSTAWNTANDFSVNNMRVGGKIVIAGGVEVYEITAVGSDTSATIGSAFVQDDVSAESYIYFEDEYALASDFLRPLEPRNFDTNRTIELIPRNEFRRRFPRNKVTGEVVYASIVDRSFSSSTTPVRRVMFHRPPSSAIQIKYPYITNALAVSSSGTEATSMSSDDDEPIVPLRYRGAIVEKALAIWYRDRRDDDRFQAAEASYRDLFSRMANDHELGDNQPKFAPRRGPYVRRAQRPYNRGRSGRFTTGDAFDELR